MSQGRDQDGFRVMLFLSLLVTAGLVFGAGVMVGVRLSTPGSPTDAGSHAATDAAATVAGGEPAPETELVFPEVLEGKQPLESLGMAARPDAGAPAPPPKAVKSGDAGTTAPASPVTPPPSAASGDFCLQVAAYREIEPAAQLAARLRDQGYGAVEVLRSDVTGKGIYFRVRLGRFTGTAEVEKMRQQLMQKLALDTLVVRCQ